MKSTNAYVVMRAHSQQMLDFAILVCTAVPQLEHAFSEFETDPRTFLATNEEFRPSKVPYSTEKRTMKKYKKVLGANLLLSVFSYFETYFFSAIDEIIDFHGGKEGLLELASQQLIGKTISSTDNEANLKFLREPHKPSKVDKYKKYTNKLNDEKVIWPSNRFIFYGIMQLIENKKRWKSADIPKLIHTLLVMNIDEPDILKFHKLRDERNKIAHGKNLSYDLQKAIDACIFFRDLSMRVDTHICENFFVIERYAH